MHRDEADRASACDRLRGRSHYAAAAQSQRAWAMVLALAGPEVLDHAALGSVHHAAADRAGGPATASTSPPRCDDRSSSRTVGSHAARRDSFGVWRRDDNTPCNCGATDMGADGAAAASSPREEHVPGHEGAPGQEAASPQEPEPTPGQNEWALPLDSNLVPAAIATLHHAVAATLRLRPSPANWCAASPMQPISLGPRWHPLLSHPPQPHCERVRPHSSARH
jgi:hypothetical protein